MIKLKKNLMGYKEDENGDLIGLSVDEYNRLNESAKDANKYRKLYLEFNNKVNELKDKVNELNKENQDGNNVLSLTANKTIEQQEIIEYQQKRIEELERKNATLFNINREMINAKRNLKPKKEHSGYVLKGGREKAFKYFTSEFNFFAYRFQTPYSTSLKTSIVREKIIEDFKSRMLNELGLEKAIVIYNLKDFKEVRKQEILANNPNMEDYKADEKVSDEVKLLLSSEEDLLINFSLVINHELWDIEFYSKNELELNLYKY